MSHVLTERPLRILQLTTNFKQGGIQRHILDLTEFLRKNGHHVTLAGAPNVWGNRDIDPEFIELRLDKVAQTGGSRIARAFAATKCARILRKAVLERQIDIVHSHETAPAIVAKLAVSGPKKLITYHGSSPDRTKQFANVSKSCADFVISPSQTTLNQLIDHGLPESRTRVLGLGIAEKPAPDPSKVSKLRTELGLQANDQLIFSLSRLDFQKGIDIMLEVASAALSTNPNLFFAVGGTGPLADEVSTWVENAGVAERFRFLGPVSDVEHYLAAADLFLLTSRWEALPISIVEAFRAGLPVIATDCGGVKELVDDTVGRLCTVGDVGGIAQAVLELASDTELKEKLAQNALTKSKGSRFDPDTVHASFEQFYQDILR